MKKALLFAIICLIAGLINTQAQEARYGIRAGINISSISSDDIPEDLEDNRIGVVVGFLAEFALTEKLGIQPELQYSSQGNKDDNLRVNYLQLPVVLKYNFTDIFNVQLGPQAGIKIWEYENNENYNTFDFAVVGGIGVNITDNFFVDARYALGLSNVFDDEGLPTSIDGNSRNIQISVGYRL
ncbi:porin family protein [Aquimarina sp. 2201CG5-10]|uniref:porin family protein n=1 Tax=Aquimarina callyspongiae TaxID=3098150 RepID=UPI002AB5C361|nr:porin family protein [Aquimarina sp. 2201CG5-10]MDY8135770.1 porin family protein [Aquimarina sp. 2201CG5-10]